MVTKYCCCCENTKAAKILGILGIIGYTICVLYGVYAVWVAFAVSDDLSQVFQSQLDSLGALENEENVENAFINEYMKGIQEQQKAIFDHIKPVSIVSLIYSILGLIANACLVAGVTKNQKNLLIGWMAMAALGGILMIVQLGMGIASGLPPTSWIQSIIVLGFLIWEFLAVLGAYQEIKEGRNNQAEI